MQVVEEECPSSPFDFVANNEISFTFREGDVLRLACAAELTPIDGLLLAGYEDEGGGGGEGGAPEEKEEEEDCFGPKDLTGARVWPGCELLVRFLAAHPALTRGRVAVELGAGTGACGLAALRVAGGGSAAAVAEAAIDADIAEAKQALS